MAAVRAGNLDAVKALLQNGAAVNTKDTASQQTALMLAVRMNQPETVPLLIEYGAEVNARTRTGKTPAWPRLPTRAAARTARASSAAAGPNAEFQEATPGGMTPLLYAARDGHADIARMLVERQSGCEPAGSQRHFAAADGHHQRSCGRRQASCWSRAPMSNAADWWGRTPLWAAVDIRNRDYVYGKTTSRESTALPALEFIQVLLDSRRQCECADQRISADPPVGHADQAISRGWILPGRRRSCGRPWRATSP